MDLQGEQHLSLGRERVWELLNDPEILRQCIPGCQELEANRQGRLFGQGRAQDRAGQGDFCR